MFSKNKSQLKDFLFSLEKLSNIASIKTAKNENEIVKSIIDGMEEVFFAFLELKQENPRKFDEIFRESDFFEEKIKLSLKPQLLKKEDSQYAELKDIFKSEEEYANFQKQARESKIIERFINYFGIILSAGRKANNHEISTYLAYHLEYILSHLSEGKDNEQQIEQFLRFFNFTAWEMASKDKEDKDNALFQTIAVNWYTNIVFNRFITDDKEFYLDYLEIFNKHFISAVQAIILNKEDLAFRSLVRSLVDGSNITPHDNGKIWDYSHLLFKGSTKVSYTELDQKHKLTHQAGELERLGKNIVTRKDLEDWYKKFTDFKSIIDPHLDTNNKKEAEKIEAEIREYASAEFKYRNLLETIFTIGSYCLYKKNTDYISYLWEYKQPADADASWGGNNIIPNTLDEVMQFYFSKGSWERRVSFWDDHHGSEQYFKKYFLLLLLRAMKHIDKTSAVSYSLPKFHVHRLSDLKYSSEQLLEVTKDLMEDKELLKSLGFQETEIEELFTEKLIPFIKSLKPKAEAELKEIQTSLNISQKKVEEFKKETIKSFEKVTTLRNVFKHYSLFKDETDKPYQGEVTRLGINIVDDKAAFFEDWHVHYGHWGQSYGENLAQGENYALLEKIILHCEESEGSLDNILKSFPDLSKVIILATHNVLYGALLKDKNFKAKWDGATPKIEINGFEGQYLFQGNNIPVFNAHHRTISNQLLILDLSKLGNLIQYNPLDAKEKPDFKKDNFYMEVTAFSENNNLLNQYLENPPDWLKNMGGQEDQKKYLLTRVLIRVLERFDYVKSEGVAGYIIKSNEQ
jgi:hypothetical protein